MADDAIVERGQRGAVILLLVRGLTKIKGSPSGLPFWH